MRSILKFTQTTLLGGLFFLVPIVVLIFVLSKALDVMSSLINPLTTRIDISSITGVHAPIIFASIAIVLCCFFAGIVARGAHAKTIMRSIETAVLLKIPGYRAFKTSGEIMLGIENQEDHPVVFVSFDDGLQIGIKIEELENGLVVVFIPDAPIPQSGSIYLMTKDRVMLTRIPIVSMLNCIREFGVGSRSLLTGISVDLSSPR